MLSLRLVHGFSTIARFLKGFTSKRTLVQSIHNSMELWFGKTWSCRRISWAGRKGANFFEVDILKLACYQRMGQSRASVTKLDDKWKKSTLLRSFVLEGSSSSWPNMATKWLMISEISRKTDFTSKSVLLQTAWTMLRENTLPSQSFILGRLHGFNTYVVKLGYRSIRTQSCRKILWSSSISKSSYTAWFTTVRLRSQNFSSKIHSTQAANATSIGAVKLDSSSNTRSHWPAGWAPRSANNCDQFRCESLRSVMNCQSRSLVPRSRNFRTLWPEILLPMLRQFQAQPRGWRSILNQYRTFWHFRSKVNRPISAISWSQTSTLCWCCLFFNISSISFPSGGSKLSIVDEQRDSYPDSWSWLYDCLRH